MKAIVGVVVLCIASQLAISVAGSAPPKQEAGKTALAKPSPKQWKRYHYEADGFAIAFPAPPQASPDPGNSGTRYVVSAENDNVAYIAAMAVLPDTLNKTTEKLFDDYVGGASKGTKSEVRSQKAISVGGYAGREILLESDTMFLDVRLILVGKRLYQLEGVATKAYRPGAEIGRFFESFELLK